MVSSFHGFCLIFKNILSQLQYSLFDLVVMAIGDKLKSVPNGGLIDMVVRINYN
jgi:hypothetical protein